jgi:hypothetical protein
MGGMFAYEGVAHLLDFKALAAFLVERNFPAPNLLLPAGSVVQIVAGLALAFGIARPYAAGALIIFTVVASLNAAQFLALFRCGEKFAALRLHRQYRRHRGFAHRRWRELIYPAAIKQQDRAWPRIIFHAGGTRPSGSAFSAFEPQCSLPRPCAQGSPSASQGKTC